MRSGSGSAYNAAGGGHTGSVWRGLASQREAVVGVAELQAAWKIVAKLAGLTSAAANRRFTSVGTERMPTCTLSATSTSLHDTGKSLSRLASVFGQL